MKDNLCSICGNTYDGYGHNAQPINDGRYCEYCNTTVVIPRRIALMAEQEEKKGSGHDAGTAPKG